MEGRIDLGFAFMPIRFLPIQVSNRPEAKHRATTLVRHNVLTTMDTVAQIKTTFLVLDTSLLEWVSEYAYAVKAYITPDSEVSNSNHAQIA